MSGLTNMVNFLVPAAGTTHSYNIFNTLLAGTTYGVDFDSLNIDGQVFMPSGVFIDNTLGTQQLIITIVPTGTRIICAAGQSLMTPYAAPNSQRVNITGAGAVAIQFVDFPVMPYASSGSGAGSAVTIADGGDIALGTTTDAPQTNTALPATVISLLKGLLVESPSLGTNVMANSSPVTLATDDTQIGTKVTAVPALGAGGGGIIGWLSTIVGKLATLGTNTMANSSPVTIATNDTQFAALLAKYSTNAYPVGATPVFAGGSGTNVTVSATLPAVAAKTNFIAGIQIEGSAATAAVRVVVTVTGVLGGTYTQGIIVPQIVSPLAAVSRSWQFNPPLQASAANVALVVSVTAFGAGSDVTTVTTQGYVL